MDTENEQTRVWASRGEEHITEEYTDKNGIVHQLHRWIDSIGLRHEADCWIDENQNEIEIDKWEDGDGCVHEVHRVTAPDGRVEEAHYRKDQHGVVSEVESTHNLCQEGTQPWLFWLYWYENNLNITLWRGLDLTFLQILSKFLFVWLLASNFQFQRTRRPSSPCLHWFFSAKLTDRPY